MTKSSLTDSRARATHTFWTRSAEADGKIKQLQRVPMLRGCAQPELHRLAAAAEIIEVPGGDVLQIEDTAVKWFYLVLGGDAIVTRDGRPLGRSGPGTMVGEVGLLSGCFARESVTACTSLRVMILSKKQFPTVLDDCLVFRSAILRSLSRRLAHASPMELVSSPALRRGRHRPGARPNPA